MRDCSEEFIGKVRLDLSFYDGDDRYSDGQVEEILLEAYKQNRQTELLYSSTDYAVLYHLSSIRQNILEWYPFIGDEAVLEIGSGCGAITELLAEKAGAVTCVELSKRRSLINAYRNKEHNNIKIIVGNYQTIEPTLKKYDLITMIGVWEYSSSYLETEGDPYLLMLKILKKHLKANGRIVIAIENKMGLKYWNGAWEDHTSTQYDGLNDYVGKDWIRTFSQKEIENLLLSAGIQEFEFLYPMPDYKLPEQLYSNEVLPKPGEIRVFGKDYQHPRFYNFNDAIVSDQICADNMFWYFSNSYVVLVGNKSPVRYVKYNRERKDKFRIATKIEKKEDVLSVVKYAIDKNAQPHIDSLKKKELAWEGILPNTTCIKGEVINGNYVVPFIDKPTFQDEFYVYRNNIADFIDKAKEYIERYLRPEGELIQFYITERFEEVFGSYEFEAKSTRITNIDTIFSNLIRNPEGGALCLDPEWIFDFPIPFEYPMFRALMILRYQYRAYLVPHIGYYDFFEACGFKKDMVQIYEKMERNFANYVYGTRDFEIYTRKYEKRAIMQKARIY